MRKSFLLSLNYFSLWLLVMQSELSHPFQLTSSFFFYYFYCCAGHNTVHCGIYESSYSMSNISNLDSPLHHSPLSSSSPIHGIISTCLIFLFT
jgi:hypothetical protein